MGHLLRSGAVVAQQAHILKVAGARPASATNLRAMVSYVL